MRTRMEIESELSRWINDEAVSVQAIDRAANRLALETLLDIRELLAEKRGRSGSFETKPCPGCGGSGTVFGDYKEKEISGHKKLIPVRVACPICQPNVEQHGE